MKKILASLGILGALAYFGLSSQKEPELALGSQTVNAQIEQSPMGTFNFGDIPDYLLSVNSTGTISIQTVGKSFSIEPSNLAIGKRPGRVKSALLNVSPKAHGVLLDKPYGDGTEIEISTKEKKMSKVVKLERSAIGALNGEYLEVSFNLGGDTLVQDGVYTGRVEIAPNVWLEKGTAWDSSPGDEENDIPNQNYTDVIIEIKNGVLTKKIPIEWVRRAQFPIYTDAIFTFGTKQIFQLAPNATVDTLKIGTNKFVNCWVDNADATQEGYCIVGSVSGTTITYGASSTAYEADIAGATNQAAGACAAGNDRWVVVYSDDSTPDAGLARVASSTGVTVNGYGTPTTFNSATTSYPTCTLVDTDTIVIAYSSAAGNAIFPDTTMFSLVCTIGADYTLSCGTPKALSLNETTSHNYADTACATADVGKFICIYRQANSTPTEWRLNAGTVSGTTITAGATTTFTQASSDSIGHTMISPDTDKFAFIFTGSNGASPIYMNMGTISGTSLTIGTLSTLMATTTAFAALIGIDVDSAFFMGQWGTTDAASTFLAAVPIELNFGTLTYSTSTPETVDVTTDPGSIHAAKISDCKFAFTWEDDNDTNDLFTIIGDIAGCSASIVDDIIWFD